MVLDSLPNKPLPFQTVQALPESSESINGVTPITVSELPDGTPQDVLAFVLSLDGDSVGWFGFVFDKDEQAWDTVYEQRFESIDVAENCFDEAATAIKEYWEEQGGTLETDAVHETDDGEVVESTLRFD